METQLKPSNELIVLWTSGDREVALKYDTDAQNSYFAWSIQR